jgi:hypothetical protein
MLGCKEIILLALYGYVLFKVLKPTQKMEMILLTVAVFFLLTNIDLFETFENPENIDTIGGSGNISGDEAPNSTVSKNKLANNLNMGPYDGLCIKTGNDEYWKKDPYDTGLIDNDKLYAFLGSQGPLKMSLSDQANLSGPPIDGEKGSVTKKFMLANNVTSPACCPSTFSTSTGCVCTTKKQRDFIASRGIPGPERINNEI